MADQYPIQQDLTSCGVYCLKYFDRFLHKEDTAQTINVSEVRLKIGNAIIQALHPKSGNLTCYLCLGEPINMRKCRHCQRTFHKTCITKRMCSLCPLISKGSTESKKGRNVRTNKRKLKEVQSNQLSEQEKGSSTIT